jgi:hypothetical protein
MLRSRCNKKPSDYVVGVVDALFVTVIRCTDVWEWSAGRANDGRRLQEKLLGGFLLVQVAIAMICKDIWGVSAGRANIC